MRAGGLQTAFMYPSFCGSLCLYTRASSSSGSPCVLRRRRAGGLLTLTSSSRYTFSLFGAVLCLDLLRPPAIRSTPCTHRACTRSSACVAIGGAGAGLGPGAAASRRAAASQTTEQRAYFAPADPDRGHGAEVALWMQSKRACGVRVRGSSRGVGGRTIVAPSVSSRRRRRPPSARCRSGDDRENTGE